MRFELQIDGMVAVHAKHAVFTALMGLEGVLRAEVELGRAVIELGASGGSAPGAAGSVDPQAAIRAAVSIAGFSVRRIRPLNRELPVVP